MKYLILMVSVLAMANCAIAQMTDCPNSIGIYFNEEATTNFLETDVPISGITAYLILTHPTGEALSGFYVNAYVEGMDSCEVELPVGAEHDGSYIYAEIVLLDVVFTTPIPAATITTLATINNITGMVGVDSICFLFNSSGASAIIDGNTVNLDIVTGDVGYPTYLPVAMINEGFCALNDIVFVSPESFTSVKNLFR